MASQDTSSAFCFRHPAHTARRRCYHCRRPVCPKCQMRSEGHIFCGDRCVRGQRRRERWERFAKWNRSALHGWWIRILLLLCLLAGGAGVVWISSRFDRFLYEPPDFSKQLPMKKVHEVGLDQEGMGWDTEGPVVISVPASGETLAGNSITVEGYAPKEAMVGLYVNGERFTVQLATEGRWRFEGVPLSSRLNLLQARYFDNRGNSSYSRAVTVALTPALPPAQPRPEMVPEIELPPAPTLDIVRASLNRREVLLTFDGGSNSNSTPFILDALKKRHAKATIFLSGEYIQRYPELVRRMAEEGHTIGNHTFSHPHLTSYSFNQRQTTLPGVTADFLRAQLSKTAGLYQLATERQMAPYWRAPFGEYNGRILSWAAESGYRHVYWSPKMDTLDWVADAKSPLFRTPSQILEGLLRQSRQSPNGMNGGIVLMHLGTEREGESRADTILESLMDNLKSQGYSFVSVEEAQPAEVRAAP